MSASDMKQVVQETIEELLTHLGIQGTVTMAEAERGIRVELSTPDSGILIGWRGSSLAAFETLVRLIVTRRVASETDQFPEIHIDIEGYRERQEQDLADLAIRLAKNVAKTGQAEVLRPMNGYERRLVHMALAEMDEVMTESIGEGPSRRIVIKPKE